MPYEDKPFLLVSQYLLQLGHKGFYILRLVPSATRKRFVSLGFKKYNYMAKYCTLITNSLRNV